jgi:hypothetical protein
MHSISDPAETANVIASWALGVSILAAMVALIAAAFAGWQAVTMHLERTKRRRAALVLLPAKPGKPRTITNEGGSAAHAIRLLVWGTPSTPRKRREAVRRLARNQTPKRMGEPIAGGKVRGSLAAGAVARLEGFGPHAEMFGPPNPVPGVSSGIDILYRPALAYWTDSRGKQLREWIEIR